jgi:DNA-binding NtrC family response regulator
VLQPGDTIHLHRQMVGLVVHRPALLERGRYLPRTSWGAFGAPDRYGIIGESAVTWGLREMLAFVARSPTHTLLLGPTGTGKELAARAIVALSGRADKPFVGRNAATLPDGLIDAELFGSARNYPNAGMPERPGLVGQADHGTLFLDEVAELPAEQQSHLLRVLDAGGEYQRLGEAFVRRSDFRLLAATNRDPTALKHDFLARFAATVKLTPLAARREDIPLLAKHIVQEAARASPDVAGRFVRRDATGRDSVRMSPGLVEAMLRDPWAGNTRQLGAAVWAAMYSSPGDELVRPPSWDDLSMAARAQAQAAEPVIELPEPSAGDIRGALEAARGSVGQAARTLGLSSRFVLYRLMKKHRMDDPQDD